MEESIAAPVSEAHRCLKCFQQQDLGHLQCRAPGDSFGNWFLNASLSQNHEWQMDAFRKISHLVEGILIPLT